jgi:phosphoribosylformimino-5-aminoimidazole carboxamide ribotide isomerase
VLIVPAIDLKRGKCVRLLRGEMDAETVYGDDPVSTGLRWVTEGARYLHVVDLDGAVSGAPVNRAIIADLATTLPIPIEVGGGIRTLERADELFDAGVDRVIFGTAALTHPDILREACRRHPGQVAVGIDARDGKVAIKGWTETSATDALALARQCEEAGACRIIYTDISRDGTQEGVNAEATAALAEKLGIPVTASGGVGSLEHIAELRRRETSGIDAVIVGRALYTGAVKLAQAIAVAQRA